jgi:hypothetical protein
MHKEIEVIYNNNKRGILKSYQLDKLIELGKIKKFRRSDGWVTVGVDPIRGNGGNYDGPERRSRPTIKLL